MRRHRDGRQTVTVTPPDTEQNRSDQNARARVREDEDFFKRFWAVYPRREGGSNEEAAREAFQRAVEDGAEPLIIIGGASGYAEQQREQGNIDTRFVAMAARWLDDKRWTETPPKVPMRSVAEIAEDMAARGWRWSSENERWERMS
jgi:hypothetical protein